MFGCVATRLWSRSFRFRRRHSGRGALYPGERLFLTVRDLLNVDEFLDDFFQVLIIDPTFALDCAKRHAPLLFQVETHVRNMFKQAHSVPCRRSANSVLGV